MMRPWFFSCVRLEAVLGEPNQISIDPPHHLVCCGHRFRCALGKGGLSAKKSEGDGTTPIGRFPLRCLLYRSDRLEKPNTMMAIRPLNVNDGWCDDPFDASYNQLVQRPFPSSHETLWRQDHIYDLIVPIGYNDAPVIPGKGSAIFIHVARPEYSLTEGCIALEKQDLLTVLEGCGPKTELIIPATALIFSDRQK